MIPKGLKIGDTFDDNGNIYEVVGYDAEGRYISQLAKNVTPKKRSKKEEEKGAE